VELKTKKIKQKKQSSLIKPKKEPYFIAKALFTKTILFK